MSKKTTSMYKGATYSDRLSCIPSIKLRQPELMVVMFAFLLNLPWEFLQIPFFRKMPTLAHWDGVIICIRATAGDVLITLVAFWVSAWFARSRYWMKSPSIYSVVTFMITGIGITVVMEYWATKIGGRWEYADVMPQLPLIDTGVLPLLQWILIPPLIIWLTQKQIG